MHLPLCQHLPFLVTRVYGISVSIKLGTLHHGTEAIFWRWRPSSGLTSSPQVARRRGPCLTGIISAILRCPQILRWRRYRRPCLMGALSPQALVARRIRFMPLIASAQMVMATSTSPQDRLALTVCRTRFTRAALRKATSGEVLRVFHILAASLLLVVWRTIHTTKSM